MAVEEVIFRDGTAAHFVERADVVGADTAGDFLDALPIRVVEVALDDGAAVLDFLQPILHIPDEGLAGAGLGVAPFAPTGTRSGQVWRHSCSRCSCARRLWPTPSYWVMRYYPTGIIIHERKLSSAISLEEVFTD